MREREVPSMRITRVVCDVCKREVPEVDPLKPRVTFDLRCGNMSYTETLPDICDDCVTNGFVVKLEKQMGSQPIVVLMKRPKLVTDPPS